MHGYCFESIFSAKLLVIITLNNKKVKIENNDSETSIIKNSTLFAMLLNIAKAFMKCCNLVKAKRRRTMKLSVCCYVTHKDTQANFCVGCYHLNCMKKL